MRFIYTYRSSDGQRHSAEIEAESRDDVYARVRREFGIRPIKVVVADGALVTPRTNEAMVGHSLWSRRKVAIAFTCVLLAAGTALCWIGLRHWRSKSTFTSIRYNSATSVAFSNILDRVQMIEKKQAERTASLNLDLLHNYALVQRLSDLSELYEEIDKGRQIVEETRVDVMSVFGDIYEIFPAECANERLEAEKLYDKLMASTDAIEQKLVDEEDALVLLDENRDKWDVRSGRLVFTDKRLEREFKFYNRPTEASSIRWRRDFGHRTIESKPVAIPSDRGK